jgi:hypothetical protein
MRAKRRVPGYWSQAGAAEEERRHQDDIDCRAERDDHHRPGLDWMDALVQQPAARTQRRQRQSSADICPRVMPPVLMMQAYLCDPPAVPAARPRC